MIRLKVKVNQEYRLDFRRSLVYGLASPRRDGWTRSLHSKLFLEVGEQRKTKERNRNGILPARNWGESQNKKEGVGEGKEGNASSSLRSKRFRGVQGQRITA